MSSICYSLMHHNSPDSVLIVLWRILWSFCSYFFVVIICLCLLLLFFLSSIKSFFGERFHVQIDWELAEVVQFELFHCIVVEVESFEYQDKMLGKSLHTCSFEGWYFLVTFITVNTIVSFHHFSRNKGFERFFQRILIQHLQTDSKERF